MNALPILGNPGRTLVPTDHAHAGRSFREHSGLCGPARGSDRSRHITTLNLPIQVTS